MRAWIGLVCALSSLGCLERGVLVLPQVDGAQSFLLVTERLDGTLSLVGIPATTWAFSITPQAEDRLTLLAYDVPLSDLHLVTGANLLSAPTDIDTRPLPSPYLSVHESVWGEGDVVWNPTEPSTTITTMRVPRKNLYLCVDEGGCLSSSSIHHDCIIPCPTSTSAGLPELTPREPLEWGACATGWRATSTIALSWDHCQLDDLRPHEVVTVDPHCEPRPFFDCPPNEAHFLGSACVRVGAPCPNGDYPDDLPVGALRVGGSTGTYSSVQAALDARAAGAIGIAAGSYPEALVIEGTKTLIGSCAERVELTHTSTVIIVRPNADVTLKNMRITGVIQVQSGAHLRLSGVVLEQASIMVASAELSLSGVSVRSARTRSTLTVRDSTLTVTRSVLTGSVAIDAKDSETHVTETAIFESTNGYWAEGGRGVLHNVQLYALSGTAIRALDSTLLLDVVYVNTSTGTGAAVVARSSSLVADRLLIEQPDRTGLYVEGGSADLNDLVLRGLGGAKFPVAAIHTSQTDLTLSRGLLIGGCGHGLLLKGGTADLSDLAILLRWYRAEKRFIGLFTDDVELVVRRIEVRDTYLLPIDVINYSAVSISDVLLLRNRKGIVVDDYSSADAVRVIARGNRYSSIRLWDEAQLRLERAFIETDASLTGEEAGIDVRYFSHLEVTDFVVRGSPTRGISMNDQSTAILKNGRVEQNEIGIWFESKDANLDQLLEHVSIQDNATNVYDARPTSDY